MLRIVISSVLSYGCSSSKPAALVNYSYSEEDNECGNCSVRQVHGFGGAELGGSLINSDIIIPTPALMALPSTPMITVRSVGSLDKLRAANFANSEAKTVKPAVATPIIK